MRIFLMLSLVFSKNNELLSTIVGNSLDYLKQINDDGMVVSLRQVRALDAKCNGLKILVDHVNYVAEISK